MLACVRNGVSVGVGVGIGLCVCVRVYVCMGRCTDHLLHATPVARIGGLLASLLHFPQATLVHRHPGRD